MGAQNVRARDLIDDASTALDGAERESKLTSALSELGQPGGPQDDPEARGVALALLAQSDTAYLPEAEQVLAEVRQQNGETNWISLHLADAYYIAADYAGAARHAREVDQSYFDERDLHWRSVKVTEILAASLLGLGDLDEGMDLARYVCGQLATRGDIDQDDLASPSELARQALSLVSDPASGRAREVGCAILTEIALTIEVRDWFPKSLADQITTAVEECA